MRDENEFSRRLRDFDAVWRRVNAAKTAAGLAAARRLPLTPRRQTQPCRADAALPPLNPAVLSRSP